MLGARCIPIDVLLKRMWHSRAGDEVEDAKRPPLGIDIPPGKLIEQFMIPF